ncbi:hypothetical protein G6F59_017426 [Rhizopus arrhizus]|nr:hypothetical protein G6F59_017426 [Rhizopus arrhizus]
MAIGRSPQRSDSTCSWALGSLLSSSASLAPEASRLRLSSLPSSLYGAVETTFTGAVSVGSIVSCMGTLSKVVSGLKKAHPKMDVRILSGKASELAGKVEDGELDAAFLSN